MEYAVNLIGADTLRVHRLLGDGNELLEVLQAWVGGYIETVPSKYEDIILIVDEEGKFKDLHYNRFATRLLREDIKDFIFGNAVLMRRDGEEIVGLTAEDVGKIVIDLALEIET